MCMFSYSIEGFLTEDSNSILLTRHIILHVFGTSLPGFHPWSAYGGTSIGENPRRINCKPGNPWIGESIIFLERLIITTVFGTQSTHERSYFRLRHFKLCCPSAREAEHTSGMIFFNLRYRADASAFRNKAMARYSSEVAARRRK